MEDKKIQKDTDHTIAGDGMEELWFSTLAADDSHTYDIDKAFGRFQRRTHLKRTSRFHISAIWYGVAAVALILIASGVSYWLGGNGVKDRFMDIVVEAPLGSKSKLILPDGSLVWLNAGSKIVYSQGFGVRDRHVRLDGEAYFEVTKHKELPFDVRTRELNVKVLGTKFNFRNYEEDEEVVVNLLEGRVQLDNHLRDVGEKFLAPSEKVILNKVTGEMVISEAKVANAKEWMNDRLFFDEMSLSDIVKELERSYNVRILIKDEKLKKCRFYALFNKREQAVEDVMDIITETGKLRYKMEGDSIILFDNK